MFGLGLGRMGLVGDLGFAIRRSLFGDGEQGLWYDLNDDSTIFQDSAGTTLASWGDPVGRVNDKSGRGNNAIQATAGSRPIRGRMPKRGRVNLIGRTQEFDNGYWDKIRASISANATTAPDGTLTADKLIENTDTNEHFVTRTFTGTAENHATSIFAKAAERTEIRFRIFNGATYVTSVYFNLSAGTAGAGGVITSVGDGWYRCSLSGLLTTSASCNIRIYLAVSGSDNYAGNGTSGVFIWGAQLETGSTATAYQHVIDSLGFNVTESGQPSCGYLSFNGSNQWMQTAASVNFSATDEMSVFAGVRKASDAARGVITELTASIAANNGAFNLTAPNAASATYAFESKGTTLTDAVATPFTAPIYNVLSGVSDISGDSSLIRVNGAQADVDTGDQGTGNYANAITYFGARAGTSLYFNGLMFSTIIRGALTSGTLLTRTEQYVARQTPTVNL